MYESSPNAELPHQPEAHMPLEGPSFPQPESAGGGSTEITCPSAGGGESVAYAPSLETAGNGSETTAIAETTPPAELATSDRYSFSDRQRITTFVTHLDKPPTTIDTPPELTTVVTQDLTSIRDRLLERFAPDTEGLNIQRVDEFVRRVGIVSTDPIVDIANRRRPEVIAALNEAGIGTNGEFEALYVPLFKTIFNFRNPILEEFNGPGQTEATRVHEIMHSSGLTNIRVDLSAVSPTRTDRTITNTSNGYVIRHGDGAKNKFLEEGMAEYVAGIYTAEVAGRPHGLTDAPSEIVRVGQTYDADTPHDATITLRLHRSRRSA